MSMKLKDRVKFILFPKIAAAKLLPLSFLFNVMLLCSNPSYQLDNNNNSNNNIMIIIMIIKIVIILIIMTTIITIIMMIIYR